MLDFGVLSRRAPQRRRYQHADEQPKESESDIRDHVGSGGIYYHLEGHVCTGYR